MSAYGPSTGATSPTGRSIRPAFASILFFALSLAPARADAISDFYKSKPVTLIVSASAGGGYDTVARTVARFLGRHLPGNPSVLVKNMAGAGGIAAANFLYNAAEKDGSQIGLLQNNTPFEPLFEHPGRALCTGELRVARLAERRNRHPGGVERGAGRKPRRRQAARDHRRRGRAQFHARFLRAADQRSSSAPSSRSSAAIPARPRP